MRLVAVLDRFEGDEGYCWLVRMKRNGKFQEVNYRKMSESGM
ncbi:MAG: hypothetical protein ACOX6S_09420 [Clostridia bacterium]